MSIKKELRKISTDPAPVNRGQVVKVTGQTLTVTSSEGVKEFQAVSDQYQKGDYVKFQGNTLIGKIPNSIYSRVYPV